MIRTLYDKFQSWSVGGSVYIISDLHFDDADCKYMDENWLSPEEHVKLINSIVHKSDTLIVLGDVGNVEWVKSLKAGYKVLITGNHDGGADNYKRYKKYGFCTNRTPEEVKNSIQDAYNIHYEDAMTVFYDIDNKLFDEVYTGPLMISDKIILSHEPIYGIDFCYNIHGHDHNKYNKGDETHLNVASNVCGYKPINLGKLINCGVLSDIKSIHRETIDNATERKKLKLSSQFSSKK